MTDREERIRNSPNHDGTKFVNPVETHMMLPGSFMKTIRRQFERNAERRPQGALPLAWPGREAYAIPPASGLRVTWMGH